nr:excinuclease ABC subunit UvrA [Gemmatimonadaceae bacterium]
MPNAIVVRGARQHNLRNVTVAIPRRAITVVTGPSGSGKSSLAFDTLYAEGQRRYVESLSAYARQFLERMEKPDVDAVEGVAPAVAIEQRKPTRTSRSTVGTATEIHDYLRLLWARVGRTSCPVCGRELRPDTVQSVTDTVRRLPEGTRLVVAFPLKRSEAVTHDVVVDNLRQQGFVRVAVAGEVLHVDELPPAPPKGRDLARAADVCVVVDRLRLGAEPDGRIPEAIATAFREGDGDCVLLFPEPVASPLAGADPAPVSRLRFTERFECPDDGHRAPSPTPQLFSFNNPRGACGVCNGFGATLEYDLALIVPDAGRSLRDGALDPWTKPRYDNKRRALAEFARREGIPMDVPWRDLDPAQHERLLRGKAKGYVGMLPFLVALEEKRYKQYIRVFLRQYQSAVTCRACGGARVGPDALCVTVAGATIADAAWWPVRELRRWLEALTLTPFEHEIADHIRREALDRIRFLDDVGLGYLTLDRATRTLSGGEAQRIGL